MTSFTGESRPGAGGSGGGLRQFQADFTGTLVNLNKVVRPDALVLNPLVAYSLGPVAQGDDSDGPVAWVWYVRVAAGGQVFLARENNARNGWNAEALLFTISGVLPTEVDLAFEQQGRAVVCAGRPTGTAGAPEVWLYYFNSVLPGFTFDSFGDGRTPRLILDNPQRPNESDVLLLYINPVSAQLELRQQRDRYTIVYPGPVLPAIAELTLEETLWTVDNRLRVLMVRRNAAAGTYTLETLDSTLYPFLLIPEDGARAGHPAVTGGLLQRALLSLGPLPFGVAAVSEDGILLPDGARPSHPAVLATSTLGGGAIIIDAVSSPARLPVEDGARPAHPSVLTTSVFGTPLILIDAVTSPARLPVEDGARPAHPAVLASSTFGASLILIVGTGNPQLPPEDAARPSAPAVLTTSTLA